MPITMNEVRVRLSAFSAQWESAARENADAKLFWARFYECFGIQPESATIYEKQVAKLGGARGFIDSFIPGKLIVEHKSKGKDLDKAFDQAAEYFVALPAGERPRYIITSDFARFRLYDLRQDRFHQCTLKGLSGKADWFRFLLDDDAIKIVEESPIDREAAYAVSKLHEALLKVGFKGRPLEIFLTRMLFCFFADDTGIFGSDGQFHQLVSRTRADGKDTGSVMSELFEVLNTPDVERQSTLDEDLAAFSYVNGSLFAERTRIPAFNTQLRQLLLDCSGLDWAGISPAIFGAMFQGVLEAHAPDERRQVTRRELGAHYTSERNILRVLDPLCMDDLRAESAASRNNKPRLQALYDRLPTLTFFDPACGCGNFLVIAYRDLRRLENEIIALLFNRGGQIKGLFDVSTLARVRVSQFFGIEIDDSAAHIARVALWITDHQMNLETAERFGTSRPSVPLIDSPQILLGNALTTDWAKDVLPPKQCTYLLGNPPFVGAKYMSEGQRKDMQLLTRDMKSGGLLDFVAGWYIKALAYIKQNPKVEVAFVSTNSITQGEQVAALWPSLIASGVRIRTAHRTFQWSNEGKGNAAVHCVIIHFGLEEPRACSIYDYAGDIKGEPTRLPAKRINPYLVDGPDILIDRRGTPICDVPAIGIGNKPIDDGHYLFTDEEKDEFIKAEPKAKLLFRPWLGSEEFINSKSRWCLWLGDLSPSELRALPMCLKRVQAVKHFRHASISAPTRKLAEHPTRFHVEFLPTKPYLIVPGVSSEKRAFVPIGFMPPKVMASNLVMTIPGATLFHFAVLNSTMHNAWLRAIGGRLKSDYRYSASIVYNNFPWPTEVSDARRAAILAAGQSILDARAVHPDSSLADLYDPLTMPKDLSHAHRANDKAVDAAYGYKRAEGDTARVAFLFDLYQALTNLPPATKAPKRARKK
jgi:hypothetical protein